MAIFLINFVVKTALIWLVLGGFFCVFSQSVTICNMHSCYKFALVLQKICTPFSANQNWVMFSCILLLGLPCAFRCSTRINIRYISVVFAFILAQKGRCSRILQLIRVWAQLTNTIFFEFFDRSLNFWMLKRFATVNIF